MPVAGGDMPLLIQLLAGLPLKNKKFIPLPRLKSFWPSWVQFYVASGLKRKRVMKPSHPVWLPAGLIRGEKALCQELWDVLGYISRATCQVLVPLGTIKNDTCSDTWKQAHFLQSFSPVLRQMFSILSSLHSFVRSWWSEIRTQCSNSQPRCFAMWFYFFLVLLDIQKPIHLRHKWRNWYCEFWHLAGAMFSCTSVLFTQLSEQYISHSLWDVQLPFMSQGFLH